MSDDWFVVNAREAPWFDDGAMGVYTPFAPGLPQYGVNLAVLAPGQPNCMYHAEEEQEDFLVLKGECLLIVEEQERLLRAWDFVHCPSGTRHVFVGAGDGPCVLLLIGTRTEGAGVVYPASEVARRHGAAVERETSSPQEAYADYQTGQAVSYGGWLPA